MSPPITSFESQFTPETMGQAGVALRDYLFRRYAVLATVASAINLAGLAFVMWASSGRGPAFYTLAFVLVVCPAWLLYRFYFAAPRLNTWKLQRLLRPQGNVHFTEEFVALPHTSGSETRLKWSSITVLEQPTLFLLILSPFLAYYIPRAAMPDAAEHFLQAMAGRGAA